MPVYRYKQISADIDELGLLVPGTLVLGSTAPFICVDITADAAAKDDLDEAMFIEGWTPHSTDPDDTPEAECATQNGANNRKKEGSSTAAVAGTGVRTAAVAGTGVLDSAGVFSTAGVNITSTSRILAFYQVGSGAPTGFLYTSALSSGNQSFAVASTAGLLDAGQPIYWQIWEPAP
jgi:hypothetical protein